MISQPKTFRWFILGFAPVQTSSGIMYGSNFVGERLVKQIWVDCLMDDAPILNNF